MQQLKVEATKQKSRVKTVEQDNKQLLVQYDELRAKVDQLQRELSKRRSQYNNRILIQVLKDENVRSIMAWLASTLF
jgi:hypothetical protein